MMEFTFLGHQSWSIQTDDAHVLVDPVLEPTFGHCEGLNLRVYPPRRLTYELMPAVDAVFLSHEHLDHFHIPSLDRLDRSVPFYVSHLLPTCVSEAIEALGFTVHRTSFETPVAIGDLEITLYAAAPETVFWEKRVCQYHVTSTEDPEGVFIGVDAGVAEQFKQAVRSGAVAPPHGYIVANNSQIPPEGAYGAYSNLLGLPGRTKRPVHGLLLMQSLLSGYLDGLPPAKEIVFCGNGFLNATEAFGPFLFSDHHELAEIGNRLCLSERIFGPYPGESIRFAPEGAHSSKADWVVLDEVEHAALKQKQRAFVDNPVRQHAAPLRPTLTDPAARDAALATVEAELPQLARAIMLSGVGNSAVHLHKYLEGDLDGRRLVFRFVVDDETAHQYVLDFNRGAFVKDDTDKSRLLRRFPFGIECFVQDFAAMLNGELQIWELMGNAIRSWWVGSDYDNIPVALFCSYGEQIRPDLAAKVYAAATERLVAARSMAEDGDARGTAAAC